MDKKKRCLEDSESDEPPAKRSKPSETSNMTDTLSQDTLSKDHPESSSIEEMSKPSASKDAISLEIIDEEKSPLSNIVLDPTASSLDLSSTMDLTNSALDNTVPTAPSEVQDSFGEIMIVDESDSPASVILQGGSPPLTTPTLVSIYISSDDEDYLVDESQHALISKTQMVPKPFASTTNILSVSKPFTSRSKTHLNTITIYISSDEDEPLEKTGQLEKGDDNKMVVEDESDQHPKEETIPDKPIALEVVTQSLTDSVVPQNPMALTTELLANPLSSSNAPVSVQNPEVEVLEKKENNKMLVDDEPVHPPKPKTIRAKPTIFEVDPSDVFLPNNLDTMIDTLFPGESLLLSNPLGSTSDLVPFPNLLAAMSQEELEAQLLASTSDIEVDPNLSTSISETEVDAILLTSGVSETEEDPKLLASTSEIQVDPNRLTSTSATQVDPNLLASTSETEVDPNPFASTNNILSVSKPFTSTSKTHLNTITIYISSDEDEPLEKTGQLEKGDDNKMVVEDESDQHPKEETIPDKPMALEVVTQSLTDSVVPQNPMALTTELLANPLSSSNAPVSVQNPEVEVPLGSTSDLVPFPNLLAAMSEDELEAQLLASTNDIEVDLNLSTSISETEVDAILSTSGVSETEVGPNLLAPISETEEDPKLLASTSEIQVDPNLLASTSETEVDPNLLASTSETEVDPNLLDPTNSNESVPNPDARSILDDCDFDDPFELPGLTRRNRGNTFLPVLSIDDVTDIIGDGSQ